jgi:nucleotide-binding universal stress UspA family protein
METIIAATDFSKIALNATKYAAALSAELNLRLMLVHVIEVPLTPLTVPLTSTEFEEIEKSVTEQLNDLKEQLLFYTADKIDIHCEIKYGFVETALESLCKEINPFAVVLGLNSDPSSRNLFLGNTALRVIPYLQHPVLIIPDNAVFSGIRNIAIASDAEQIHENLTVQSIKKWLNSFHVQPDIIHVKTDEKVGLQALTNNIFVYNHFLEFHPRFHSIHNKNVEEGIFGFIEQSKPDLLFVVPGKYSFFKKLFHASHSKQMILHSHLPVLVVPTHKLHTSKKEKETFHKHGYNACDGCDGLCCQNKVEKTPQGDKVHVSKTIADK